MCGKSLRRDKNGIDGRSESMADKDRKGSEGFSEAGIYGGDSQTAGQGRSKACRGGVRVESRNDPQGNA
jgi:hypothetical protein